VKSSLTVQSYDKAANEFDNINRPTAVHIRHIYDIYIHCVALKDLYEIKKTINSATS